MRRFDWFDASALCIAVAAVLSGLSVPLAVRAEPGPAGTQPAIQPVTQPAISEATRNALGKKLLSAVTHWDDDEALRLIAEGANVNQMDRRRTGSPLFFAVQDPQQQHVKLVAILIGRGADVEQRGIGGATPLHNASMFGNRQAAALLLAVGANPRARSVWEYALASRRVLGGRRWTGNLRATVCPRGRNQCARQEGHNSG
jgi:ankyrin repeat protein